MLTFKNYRKLKEENGEYVISVQSSPRKTLIKSKKKESHEQV